MPEALERALLKRAYVMQRQGKLKHGKGKKARDAFVYGTMRKQGWRPSRERR